MVSLSSPPNSPVSLLALPYHGGYLDHLQKNDCHLCCNREGENQPIYPGIEYFTVVGYSAKVESLATECFKHFE
jgi:hypothetical protein